MSRSILIAALAAVPASAACSAEAPTSDAQISLGMYTWWTKGGEKDALDELERIHRKRYPNVSLLRNAARSADEAFDKLDAELAYTQPPDTFQVNGGSLLFSRVVFDRKLEVSPSDRDAPADAGIEPREVPPSRLEPIDDLYTQTGAALWSFLTPLVRHDEKYYAVPLNLHRINNLYFNIEKLRNVGLFETNIADSNLPTDIDEFMAFVRKLYVATGKRPLAIGIRDPWPLETLVFENLLPSVAISASDLPAANPPLTYEDKLQFFERFWKGKRQPHDDFDYAVLEGALRRAQELWDYTLVSGDGEEPGDAGAWTDAFDALMDPESDVCLAIMGDWATGYLQSEHNAEYMKNFGLIPFPGTEKLFIYTTDTLPLSVGAKHPNETREFLTTALQMRAQLAFNRVKGSVPALRLDAEHASGLTSEFQQEALRYVRDDSVWKSVAVSGLVTPDISIKDLREQLRIMLKARDPLNGREMVHHTIESYYWLLQVWTDTLESPP